MAEMLERFRALEIPPHVTRALGLPKNWKEKVSEEFASKVLDAVTKHQDALRKLKDY